jgi:hypothetical protein
MATAIAAESLGATTDRRMAEGILMRRTRALHGDSGAATLELTAMQVAVAVIVAAVIAVLIPNAPFLADQARYAFCIVFSAGQGDCAPPRTTAAQHRPTEPCVIASSGHESEVAVSFVVTLSDGEKWQVDQLNDGTYRITRGDSSGIGVDAGVGFDVTVDVDDSSYGAAAHAGVSAKATFGSGEVYYAKNQDEVNKLLIAHTQDVLEDDTVGSSGPFRWVTDEVGDLVGVHHGLPTPDAQYIEGGISLSADAKASLATASASGEAGVTAVLGYLKSHDGSTTEYYQANLSGSAQASILGSNDQGSLQRAKAGLGGNAEGDIEIDRDSKGNITAVRITSILAGELDAQGFNGASGGPSGYTEHTVELPVKTDSDKVIADNFLTAMGMPDIGGFNLPPGLATQVIGLGTLGSATDAFTTAAQNRGFITEQSYDHEDSKNGGTFDAEAIAKAGGSVSFDTNSRAVTGGQYFDGTRMVPWTTCGG